MARMVDAWALPAGFGPIAPLAPVSFGAGFIKVELPPQGVVVLKACPKALGGYSRYKRAP